MRKDRYYEQFKEHLPYLRNFAEQNGLTYDEADEVVSQCAERLLVKKTYVRITSRKLKAFLRTAVRFGIRTFKRATLHRDIQFPRLPDFETVQEDPKVKVTHSDPIDPVQERECPFCFLANLNEYGACHMCHTIIPHLTRVQKYALSITEESLAVEFDFNTKIDVQNAIAQLTPYEQRLVWAVGLGNESLESFALDNQVSKTSLVRTWVTVKAKLQQSLREYAPTKLSSRGASAFRRALQSIEKTQE